MDIHRLPQYPVRKNGRPFSRPIIVKLLTMHDKHLIFKSVKHLQSFNNAQKNEDQSVPYVYVTEHLPKKFQDQRKQLLPIFNDARKNKKKVYWKAIDGNYTLFVEGKQIDPTP